MPVTVPEVFWQLPIIYRNALTEKAFQFHVSQKRSAVLHLPVFMAILCSQDATFLQQ